MISNVGEPCTGYGLPTKSNDGCANCLFLSVGLGFKFPEDQLDLQGHQFIINPSFDFLGKKACIERLNTVLRPPRAEITK